MQFFLACICLFFIPAIPQGDDPQTLATADTMDQHMLQIVECVLDNAPYEQWELDEQVFQQELARNDPNWLQQGGKVDPEALDKAWQTVQENRQRQAMLDKMTEARTQILDRQARRKEAMLQMAAGPELQEGTPEPDAMLQGLELLPQTGGVQESSGLACAVGTDLELPASQRLIDPVPGSWISAGTWAYPNGQTHLGLDLAASLYTPVVAPANGLVVYAHAPVDSNSGYLGNWSGFPMGGGNTILLLCPAEKGTLAIAFCHLSDQLFVVPGQQVSQGQTIALSGNSGNSTGPHTHIEIIHLDLDLQEAAAVFVASPDFSFGNGYDQPGTCSAYGCRVRPELYIQKE